MALGKRIMERARARVFAHALAAMALAGVPVLLTSTPAVAAEPTAIKALEIKVAKSLSAWESAKRAENDTRARAETLAHRIEALKRLRAKYGATFAGGDELDALLKESIDAEAALRASKNTVTARANDVKKGIAELVPMIDARVRELLPKLKQGSMEERSARARAINELLAVRSELAQTIARLSDQSSIPREWAKYEVQIESLDSPDELDEKADFVEDTRDRFERKREELAKLIAEVKREQEISRAAQEFKQDIGIFDEEARRGRVTKQASGGSLEAVTLGDTKNNRVDDELDGRNAEQAPGPQAPPPQAGAPPGGFTAPPPPESPDPNTTGVTDTTPPPPAPPVDPTRGSGGGGGTTQPPPSTQGVSGGTRSYDGPITRQLDPNELLNLRVDKIDSKRVKLETLEGMVSDLNRLERFLDSRAAELRKRAKQLKKDEETALGKTK